MKKNYLKMCMSLTIFSSFFNTQAQSTYNSNNYAIAGDTMYVTLAKVSATNFDAKGAGLTWDYSNLEGVSQQQQIFRQPTQTGFSNMQWHYLYVPSNVNLSSTNGETYEIGTIKYTNPNDYFFMSANDLQQKATSYNMVINGMSFSVKNVYTAPDVLYKFPINYNNSDSATASYVTSIPSVYYRECKSKRVNKVEGWGTVITPYGTFTNALKITSNVMQIDSFNVAGVGSYKDTLYFREYKWLDPSKKYPVLYVKQNRVNNTYVTSVVQYLDKKIYFQPTALFAYLPAAPSTGDTVYFQNLSLNTTDVSWNFADPVSGATNASIEKNPYHVFNSAGTYKVKLSAYNGSLSDEVEIPVVVQDVTTGVQKLTAKNISVYPNPASKTLYVDTKSNLKEIYLYDLLGNKILSFTPTEQVNAIDISHLESGIYFIKTNDSIQKIIIQH